MSVARAQPEVQDRERAPIANRRTRVCHVCASHSADDGRVFHRACVALAQAGYDVHLIARSERTKPYQERGVTVHPVPEWRSRRDRLIHRSRTARMAADLEPDLFHVHEPELLGPVIARAGSSPVVWDVHESYLSVLMDRDWIPRPLRPIARLAWDLRERRLLRRCAGVIAATERVADRYRALHENVQTVANYLDLSELDGLPPVARDGRTCVYAGTILPNRGLDHVLAAMALLKERGLTVPLAVAGPGDERYLNKLWSEAERLGVRQLVTYHGVLTKHEALLIQHRSSIGVLSGLPVGNNLAAVPIKMVECMALGLPLVFSDFPSHQEIAGGAGAGIAFEPGNPERLADAVEQLVRNPEMARRMGESGSRAVRDRFNWSIERAKLLNLYRKVLNDSMNDTGAGSSRQG